MDGKVRLGVRLADMPRRVSVALRGNQLKQRGSQTIWCGRFEGSKTRNEMVCSYLASDPEGWWLVMKF